MPKKNKYQEAIIKIKAIRDNFFIELNNLKKERRQEVEQIKKQQTEDNINQIRNNVNNL